MANKTKEAKTSKKLNINIKSTVKKFVARPVAYVALITTSAYGIRGMLHTLDENAAIGLTVLLVLSLTYIIFDSE